MHSVIVLYFSVKDFCYFSNPILWQFLKEQIRWVVGGSGLVFSHSVQGGVITCLGLRKNKLDYHQFHQILFSLILLFIT